MATRISAILYEPNVNIHPTYPDYLIKITYMVEQIQQPTSAPCTRVYMYTRWAKKWAKTHDHNSANA